MFKNIDDFRNWIELAKTLDDKIIENGYEFVRNFPFAEFDDYIKALERLKSGKSVEVVITSYQNYQASLGLTEAKEDYKRILTMDDCREEMLYDLEHGKEKGTSTYIEGFDNVWTWRLGQFNIWTGYSNEGKSLFLRFLCLIKAIKEQWKFAFYAPEDYPAKEFFDDIIHTASGYSTDKDNPNFIGSKVYNEVMDQIKDYFYFVYIRPPHNSLLEIFKEFIPVIQNDGVKVCVVDPLIKVHRPKEYMNADDKYAGYVTTLGTDFSRQFHVSLNLVMHQLTPRLQENHLYPKPSMYYIKGGGTWADGTDDINSIQRPYYANDKISDDVIFTSQKIKKQKLVGIPGEFPMRFDRKTNRYINGITREDLFDFDKHLHIGRMKFQFQ